MNIEPRSLRRAGLFFTLILVTPLLSPGSLAALPTSEELQKAVREGARLEREERWVEARELYLDLGMSYPIDRNVLYGLERVHRAIDDDGRYLQFLRENYRRYPRDIVLFRHYLDLSVRSGVADEIEPDVRLFIANRKSTESTYRSLYSILQPMDLHDLSEKVLLEGEKALGDSSLFSRELSDLYHQAARYEESLEEALNFLSRSPESLPFVKKRIESLRSVMAGEDIIGRIEEYSARQKRSVAALTLHSWVCLRFGEMRNALSISKELSERNVEAGIEALRALAKACEAGGDFQTGIEAFRTLGSLEPSRKVPYDLEIARLLRMAGEPKKAGQVYRSVLESDPDSLTRGDVCFSLGEIALYDLHRPEEALDWLERSAGETGDSERSIGARLARIPALVFVGDMDGAVAEGERASAIELSAESRMEVDYFRGVVDLLDGRTDEGRELLERVSGRSGHFRANDALEVLTWLDMDPSADLAVARGLTERNLMMRVEKPERAIDRLERLRVVAGRTPLSADVDYCQAKMFRETGQYGRAIERLEEIVSRGKDHRLAALARWEMADIYRRDLGEPGRAISLLEQVILEQGNSVVAPRARRDLEEIEGDQVPVL